MYLARYAEAADDAPILAVVNGVEVHRLPFDLDELLRRPLDEIRELVRRAGRDGPLVPETSVGLALPPVTGRTEVWGAGVTYERSRSARVEESQVADVYSLVYEAVRPELFFKAPAWRVVTSGDAIGIREDSALNVPEPEVAVVANRFGEIVGYTICNDVTSRSIEGENPLYLPQAKIYSGSCAIHSAIRPVWEIDDPANLAIRCEISRDGVPVWRADGNTSRMRRTFEELVAWAFAGLEHPDGVLISTGTMLVPEMDTSLEVGDVVSIEVDGMGTLRNTVRRGVLPGGTS